SVVSSYHSRRWRRSGTPITQVCAYFVAPFVGLGGFTQSGSRIVYAKVQRACSVHVGHPRPLLLDGWIAIAFVEHIQGTFNDLVQRPSFQPDSMTLWAIFDGYALAHRRD